MKVIWDLDGTLFDTWNTHVAVIREVKKKLSGNNLSIIRIIGMQGNTLDKTLTNIFGIELFQEAKKLYVKFFQEAVSRGNVVDCIDVIDFLKRYDTYEHVIITGRDRETCESILYKHNIRQYFSEVYCIEGKDLDKYEMLQEITGIIDGDWYISDDENERIYLNNRTTKFILATWYRTSECKSVACISVKDLDDLSEIFANKCKEETNV